MQPSTRPAVKRSPRRPPPKIVLKSQDEKTFEAHVKRLARFYGYCGFHISFSHGAVTGVHTLGLGDDHYDSNGFPDWIFVGHGKVLFRELKAVGKYLTQDQKRWHRTLTLAGQDVSVWRPTDEDLIIDTFKAVT